MDVLQFILDNVNKLGVGDSYDFLVFLGISFLIGIITLTWRYALSYKTDKERKKWSEENLLNKIIISILLGGSSYIAVLIFRLVMIQINSVTQPSAFNFSWILLAMVYSIGYISSKSKTAYLVAVKDFLKFTWELTIFLLIWIILLSLSNNSIYKWIVFIVGGVIILIWIDKTTGWKILKK